MRAGLLLASIAIAVGCGPTLGVRGQLTVRARDELTCQDVERVLQLAEDAFEVDGCQRMVEYTDVQAGEGREWVRMLPAVRLAAEDMQCGLDQLREGEDATPVWRSFSGCGARATYALGCSQGVGCRWTRDGDVVRTTATLPITPTAPAVITPVSTPPSSDVVPPPPGAT